MKLLDVDYKKVEDFEKEQGIEIEVKQQEDGLYIAIFTGHPIKRNLLVSGKSTEWRTGTYRPSGKAENIQLAIKNLINNCTGRTLCWENEFSAMGIGGGPSFNSLPSYFPNLFKEVPLNFNPPEEKEK
jgi:hypothetical protein